MGQRGFIHLVLASVLIVFVLLTLGIGAYFYSDKLHQTSDNGATPSLDNIVSESEVEVETTQSTASGKLDNWKTYTSQQCHIVFEYPGDWQVLSSVDDAEFGCLATFGIQNDSSNILMFSTPRGMSWEEMVSRYPDSKKTNVKGYEGILTAYPRTHINGINFMRGSMIFQLGLVYSDNYKESDPMFEHIIQSVEFTGTDSDYNKSFKTLFPEQ